MKTRRMMEAEFRARLQAAAELSRRVAEQESGKLARAVQAVAGALGRGNKILLFGNGGSAADAQHLAAEFVNRFLRNRRGLPAIAITTDSSVLTSIANDFAFERVFARQIEALGRKGDVAWGFSTSGRSPNVLQAFQTAKRRGLYCLGFAGKPGSPMARLSDLCVEVDAESTPRIQEMHILLGHLLCEQVEEVLFGRGKK